MKTNKELKEEYKQMKFTMGVFQLRNKQNGKLFIDGSINLKAYQNRIIAQLEVGLHPNAALQHDWKMYGESEFVFELLSEVKEKKDAAADYKKEVKELAALFIEELKPFAEKGYHERKI